MIKFTCPHCQAAFNVEDQFAGRSGPCRSCQQQITIPPAASPPLLFDSEPPPINPGKYKPAKSNNSLPAFALFLAGSLCGVIGTIGYQQYLVPRNAYAEGKKAGEEFQKGLAETMPMFRNDLADKDEDGETLFSTKELRLVLLKTEYATRFKIVGQSGSFFLTCDEARQLKDALLLSQDKSDQAKRGNYEREIMEVGKFRVGWSVSQSGNFTVSISDQTILGRMLIMSLPDALDLAKHITKNSSHCQ